MALVHLKDNAIALNAQTISNWNNEMAKMSIFITITSERKERICYVISQKSAH